MPETVDETRPPSSDSMLLMVDGRLLMVDTASLLLIVDGGLLIVHN